MRTIYLLLITVFFASCSKDEAMEAPSTKNLTEKLVGVWRQTKATYTDSDGNVTIQAEDCSLKNELGFSQDGSYRVDDYEGGDLKDCYHSIFEGSWRAETDPDNPDTNIKIRNDRVDGQSYLDDWDYAKVVFSGNNKMILIYKDSSGSSSTYEHDRIQ